LKQSEQFKPLGQAMDSRLRGNDKAKRVPLRCSTAP
jgi:hypothetical protein